MRGVTCTRCHGTGGHDWTPRVFHEFDGEGPCEGPGGQRWPARILIGVHEVRVVCGACDGTGEETLDRPIRRDRREARPIQREAAS